MANFVFALLDPRNTDAAKAANEAVFTAYAGQVLGIEVTIPSLAARCNLGNIDPQHQGGDSNVAAIEIAAVGAVDYRILCDHDGGPRPSEWPVVTLVTVRADLDSVGSMAVLDLLAERVDLSPASERIALVAASDKFARGDWPGPRPLPASDNPWPEEAAGAADSRPLAAIAAAVADFKIPIEERVAVMRRWLLTGEEPTQYRVGVEKERMDLVHALENGDISVNVAHDGKIAVVNSSHRAAMVVGYASAPVVVAKNPSFRLGGGEPHVKFTVAQFALGHLDLRLVLAELSELEPGWGGSPTIGGSPQGVSSSLTIEQVVEVVARHLK